MPHSLSLAALLLFCFAQVTLGPAGKRPSVISPGDKDSQDRQQRRININRASIEELKSLPGIGQATAQRIVEYRAKNPPFRKIEELMIIRGISRERLERIRDRIRVH
jgi:competence protein ComEA